LYHGLLLIRNLFPTLIFLFFAAGTIPSTSPKTVLWTAPAILASSLMIAWGAESAQYFIALAILAWMQTLPEFAVEAVFAWKQQTPLLLANLTGALRLLTGLGWPVIYLTAAIFHRRRGGTPLKSIKLDPHHSVEVIGLLVPLIYIAVICAKATLNIFDAAVLIAAYAAYLAILSKLPPEEAESIEDLETIPRAIVTSPRRVRLAVITALFLGGALAIRYTAEPFVGSLLAIAGVLGVSSFLAVQWLAPIVSEFPEMASTVYFARSVEGAPMALMNMVSSNINQWTLLVAMLPIVFSISAGHIASIQFDTSQQLQLLMTLGQALVAVLFLINMELAWWEAVALLALFAAAFVSPMAAKPVTAAYFLWAGFLMWRLASGQREPVALVQFVETWQKHVQSK
jgi:cation:H+ antiporter